MKKSKLPNLVTVLIITLVTAVVWISFSVYRALTVKPAPSVPQAISDPLTPTLDKDAINQLEGRLFLNDSEIPDNVASGITLIPATPSATPISQETALPSPTPSSIETASPSATPASQ